MNTKEELMHYKSVLHSNVLVGISTLIDMAPKLGYTVNPGLQVCLKGDLVCGDVGCGVPEVLMFWWFCVWS